LWSEQLQEELTRWWKIIKEKLVAENSNAIRLEINEHVDRRCEMIKNNQSRMINSLLEKPFKKVAIDRLLINKVEGNELLNNPEEVLNATAEHFRSQFKKRSFQKEGMTYEWEKVYSPIAEIKESYYKNLNKKITDEEWTLILSKLKMNTALGISGIRYVLIKQENIETQVVF